MIILRLIKLALYYNVANYDSHEDHAIFQESFRQKHRCSLFTHRYMFESNNPDLITTTIIILLLITT